MKMVTHHLGIKFLRKNLKNMTLLRQHVLGWLLSSLSLFYFTKDRMSAVACDTQSYEWKY
jgi:hypothetical protein